MSNMCSCGKAEKTPKGKYCSACTRSFYLRNKLSQLVCERCNKSKHHKHFEVLSRKGSHIVRSGICNTCAEEIKKLNERKRVFSQSDNHGREFTPTYDVPVARCICGNGIYKVSQVVLDSGAPVRCQECMGFTSAPIGTVVSNENKDVGVKVA